MKIPEPTPDSGIKQILVALDTPGRSAELIERAAMLALQLQAGLTGLFVEDINLLRLAALPFAHELPYDSLPERRLDQLLMERALRARATAIQKHLASSAGRANIPWSFQVRRGHVLEELLASAPTTDLLIIGEFDQTIVSAGDRPSMLRQILLHSSCSVWAQHCNPDSTRAVLVLYDASATSNRALQLASRMARDDTGQSLLVLLPPDGSPHSQKLQQRAAQHLGRDHLQLRYLPLTEFSASRLLAVMRQQRGRVLVAAEETLAAKPALLQQLADQLSFDFVLVR